MKKLLSLILALTMVLCMFAGCQSNETTPTTQATAAPTQASSQEPAQTADETSSEWPAIGTADAPVTVKVMVKDVFPSEEDVQKLQAVISEKMAAHGQYVNVEFAEPPASGYKTAVPLAMMNGEVDADLVYFQGGDQALAAQGLLEDLTSYIEGSTYVKNLMEETNVEKLANYPYLLWLAPPRVSTPGIRTDLAEQTESFAALMEDPTIDNYYAFMKELKEKGLCTYALTADGDTSRFDSIFNHAFGVTGTCVQENGQWIFAKASQAEKAKLEFYAKLYAEGLMDPDYLTNTWDVMEQRWYEGTAAIVAGTAGATVQVYDTKMQSVHGEQATLTILPPAKGESQSYTSIDVTKESRGFAINADSENKDAAWAVLEFMASPEGRILDKVGIEGEQYTVEDNKIVFTDKFSGWWARFWDTTYKFEPENPSLTEPVLTPAASQSLDMVNQYAIADHGILIPDEMSPQWDAMKNLYNEYASDIIRGVKSIDSFDQFVEEWNNAGGNDFAPLLQEAFG